MVEQLVNREFEKLVQKRGVHNELGVSSEYIRSLRDRLKKNKKIKLDAKLMLLRKSGWTYADKQYDRHDLFELARLILKSGDDAKILGPGYFVDKFERGKCAN